MRRPLRREVVVRGLGAGARTGLVTSGPLVLACALGRNGACASGKATAPRRSDVGRCARCSIGRPQTAANALEGPSCAAP